MFCTSSATTVLLADLGLVPIEYFSSFYAVKIPSAAECDYTNITHTSTVAEAHSPYLAPAALSTGFDSPSSYPEQQVDVSYGENCGEDTLRRCRGMFRNVMKEMEVSFPTPVRKVLSFHTGAACLEACLPLLLEILMIFSLPYVVWAFLLSAYWMCVP